MADVVNYDRAQQTAHKLLHDYGYTSPPVSPIDISGRLGIEVIEVEMPEKFRDVSGFIDMDKKIIYVNKSDPFNRKTFTIAHEIGHFLLHKEKFERDPGWYRVLYRTKPMVDQETTVEEKEANCFAASLLVPLDQLKRYESFPSSIQATIFGVSQEVIEYRRKSLPWQSG